MFKSCEDCTAVANDGDTLKGHGEVVEMQKAVNSSCYIFSKGKLMAMMRKVIVMVMVMIMTIVKGRGGKVGCSREAKGW